MNGRGVDPFTLTPDTRAYVPRPATERALAELVAAVHAGSPPVALVGGGGVGKTLLLHLLAERLGPGLRSVYLPNPRLSPFEVCTWIARRLGTPAGEDAVAFLRAWIAHLREQDEACLLLVDDADAMPEATAHWLGAFAAESQGGLRLALAALAGAPAERVLRALGPAQRVDPGSALTREEAKEYVAWRLERAGAPAELRARLDPKTLDDLHRVARGNPRRLHLAIAAVLRGGSPDLLEDELTDRAAAAAPPAPLSPPPPAPAPAARATRPSWRPRFAALLLAALATALVATLLARMEPGTPLWTGARSTPAAAPQTDAEPGAPGAAGSAGAAASAEPLRVNLNAVPWARIEVDGIEVGETPLAGVPLRPGPHTFRAELPDGRIVERRVEIDAANRHLVFE